MSQSAAPGFLAHRDGDSVGVAVRDLPSGPARGATLHGATALAVELREDVPLGHKIALVDIDEGADVVEYGVRIGIATRRIRTGELVHVHNLRSARWQSSVA